MVQYHAQNQKNLMKSSWDISQKPDFWTDFDISVLFRGNKNFQ